MSQKPKLEVCFSMLEIHYIHIQNYKVKVVKVRKENGKSSVA